jgi:YesN/AraC family two-component response regulator
MNPLRVMVVDDERLARLHLARLLSDHPGILVVGEAANLTEATALLAREVIDVIFLDVSMPPENGFDLLPQVRVLEISRWREPPENGTHEMSPGRGAGSRR